MDIRITVGMRTRNEISLVPYKLANLKYADEIFISDQESDDGTYEYLLSRSVVDKRIKLESFPFSGWFTNQGDHLRSLMEFVSKNTKGFDWFQYTDVDDIPNIIMQNEVKMFLSKILGHNLSLCVKYLSLSDWTHYYEEISRNRMWWMWNFLPEIRGSDQIKPLFEMQAPDIMVDAPDDWYITHWDYCCLKRFEDKLIRYKDSPAAHGQEVWRPENRFFIINDLPNNIEWYGLNNNILKPTDMVNIKL